MKVRALFIHPTQGIRDVGILKAESVEKITALLEDVGCKVLFIKEEKDDCAYCGDATDPEIICDRCMP